jgi:hypothetical protein
MIRSRAAIYAALENLTAAQDLMADYADRCAVCGAHWRFLHTSNCPASGMLPMVFDALTGEHGRVIA